MKKLPLVFILSALIITAQAQVNYVSNVYAKSASQSAVSHNGKFLFLSSFHEIIVYEINPSTGALTKKRTLPSPTNSEFCGMHLSPDDKFLYTQSATGPGSNTTAISTYACNPLTGELKLKNTIDHQGTETFELSMTNMSPRGNFLFVANNRYKDLFVYRRNVIDGLLSFQQKISTGELMMFFDYVISPDEKFMYVNCANIYKEATIYSIDQNTGNLTKVTEVTNPNHPSNYAEKLMVSPDGKNVYAIERLYQPATQDYLIDLTQYSRDEQTGMMSYQAHYPQGYTQLDYLFIDGSGENVYASQAIGTGMHAFHVFKRDPSTGNLTRLQTFFDSGTTNRLAGCYVCSFSKDNRFMYVSAIDDDALNIFKNPNAKASLAAPSVNVPINTQGTDDPVFNGTTATPTSDGSIYNGGIHNGGTTSQPTGPVSDFPKEKFNEIRKKLQAETSDTQRMDLCYKLLEGKALSTMQVASIAMLFDSEYQRLEYVKFEYYFVNDKEHYKQLGDLFTYDSILQEFNKLVQ